jgi:hypothetical protein
VRGKGDTHKIGAKVRGKGWGKGGAKVTPTKLGAKVGKGDTHKIGSCQVHTMNCNEGDHRYLVGGPFDRPFDHSWWVAPLITWWVAPLLPPLLPLCSFVGPLCCPLFTHPVHPVKISLCAALVPRNDFAAVLRVGGEKGKWHGKLMDMVYAVIALYQVPHETRKYSSSPISRKSPGQFHMKPVARQGWYEEPSEQAYRSFQPTTPPHKQHTIRLRPKPNESWRILAQQTQPLNTKPTRALSKFALAQNLNRTASACVPSQTNLGEFSRSKPSYLIRTPREYCPSSLWRKELRQWIKYQPTE